MKLELDALHALIQVTSPHRPLSLYGRHLDHQDGDDGETLEQARLGLPETRSYRTKSQKAYADIAELVDVTFVCHDCHVGE